MDNGWLAKLSASLSEDDYTAEQVINWTRLFFEDVTLSINIYEDNFAVYDLGETIIGIVITDIGEILEYSDIDPIVNVFDSDTSCILEDGEPLQHIAYSSYDSYREIMKKDNSDLTEKYEKRVLSYFS